MSIENYFNATVSVQRLAADADGIGEEYAPHIASVPCHIQPLDESISSDIDGSFGKDELIFCEAFDILEGDQITNGDKLYKVVGIEAFKFRGRTRHMEVRIRHYNE